MGWFEWVGFVVWLFEIVLKLKVDLININKYVKLIGNKEVRALVCPWKLLEDAWTCFTFDILSLQEPTSWAIKSISYSKLNMRVVGAYILDLTIT